MATRFQVGDKVKHKVCGSVGIVIATDEQKDVYTLDRGLGLETVKAAGQSLDKVEEKKKTTKKRPIRG